MATLPVMRWMALAALLTACGGAQVTRVGSSPPQYKLRCSSEGDCFDAAAELCERYEWVQRGKKLDHVETQRLPLGRSKSRARHTYHWVIRCVTD